MINKAVCIVLRMARYICIDLLTIWPPFNRIWHRSSSNKTLGKKSDKVCNSAQKREINITSIDEVLHKSSSVFQIHFLLVYLFNVEKREGDDLDFQICKTTKKQALSIHRRPITYCYIFLFSQSKLLLLPPIHPAFLRSHLFKIK